MMCCCSLQVAEGLEGPQQQVMNVVTVHFYRIVSITLCRSYDDVVLVIIGSTRHEEDRRLKESLEKEAQRLGLAASVRFEVNQPYSVLLRYMQSGAVGLHTMWNEHFGISIVEMMAAGLVVVAHNSGGPLMDIVTPTVLSPTSGEFRCSAETTGCLAETPEQYAHCIRTILDNYDSKDMTLLKISARKSTLRFSDEVFMSDSLSIFEDVLK